MNEVEWVLIPDTRGAYEVSNDGRVRSVGIIERFIDKYEGHIQYSHAKREWPQGTYKTGYKYVKLYIPTAFATQTHMIHRLVANAFLGECPPKHVVHHKDGDKTNNNASNLEYIPKTGHSRRHSTKYTVEQVREVKRMLRDGIPRAEVAAELGMPPATVWSIEHGRTWKNVKI